jgi:hypothetical protein
MLMEILLFFDGTFNTNRHNIIQGPLALPPNPEPVFDVDFSYSQLKADLAGVNCQMPHRI